jgi:hypothetical protein
MLAQTVAKQGSKDLNQFGKNASVIMMETILPLTEQVGKMRGMGSGIVAKKSITEAQKFAISSMLSEINNLESSLQSDMSSLVASNGSLFDSTVKRNLSQLHTLVKEYTDLTNKKVLASNPGHCESSKYFNYGTDIISTLINIFNSSNKAIMKDSKGWI